MDLSPHSASKSSSNDTKHMKCGQSSSSSDDGAPVATDGMSVGSRKPRRNPPGGTYTVVYGPILIKRHSASAPTLATGRRSKHEILEGEDATKLESRRMKNRESARNLKKIRDNIENELKSKINELESKEPELIMQVNTLVMYKQYLEEQCQHLNISYNLIDSPESSEVELDKKQTSQNAPIPYENIEPKEEPYIPLVE